MKKLNRKGEGAMKEVFLALIIIVVGLALISTVVVSSNAGANATTSYSGANGIVKLMPVIFVVIILLGAVAGMLKVLGIV